MNATGVTVGLAESNGSLLPGIWRDSLHVTCGLTACTPGSAPGPTLGNEYVKTLPFFTLDQSLALLHVLHIDEVFDRTSGLRPMMESLFSQRKITRLTVMPVIGFPCVFSVAEMVHVEQKFNTD